MVQRYDDPVFLRQLGDQVFQEKLVILSADPLRGVLRGKMDVFQVVRIPGWTVFAGFSGVVDVDDQAIRLLGHLPGTAREALKWGLLLFFGGIGLIVLSFVPYDMADSPLPYGIEAVFLSAGFLLYYGISSRRK